MSPALPGTAFTCAATSHRHQHRHRGTALYKHGHSSHTDTNHSCSSVPVSVVNPGTQIDGDRSVQNCDMF